MTISPSTASQRKRTKMEEIEAFVRKLCAEGDLSVLSKKLIRTQYQACYNKESLSREEKDKINQVLEAVIQELADQTKKSKSKKRKASCLEEADQPLKKKRSLPLADRSDNDAFNASDKDCDEEEDTPVKVKKLKRKKRAMHLDLSDEDDLPSTRHAPSDQNEQPLKLKTVSVKFTPLKKKKSSKKKKMTSVSSSDDDQPLKKSTSVSSAGQSEGDTSNASVKECEEDTPVKLKVAKTTRSVVLSISSSEEDDLPLKPRSVHSKASEANETNGKENGCMSESDRDGDDDDSSPLKTKPVAKRNRIFVDQDEDEDEDEDDLPLKPKPGHSKTSKEQEDSISESEGEDDVDDTTPLKTKKSSKAVVVASSDENSSASEVQVKRPDDHLEESDLDTTSLSSDGENEAPIKYAGSKSKPAQRKLKTAEVQQKKNKQSTGKSSMKGKEPKAENVEAPYLKRLRLICRKVGIFVRNSVHFAGCTTDNEKIERLKGALKKAGMKGQPSLSKVESVNLQREAEALDTTNIIETAGRPKRKPKDVFSRTDSPKKSLTPIKQQFSRIKDLISDSESD